MQRSVRVAVGLVWSRSRLLVGRRPATSVLPGFDEFPGGKCRKSETFHECVVRECLEETGFSVEVTGRRAQVEHTYEHGSLELEFFDCRLTGNEVDAACPHPPFRWVTVDAVLRLRFPAANAALLESIKEFPRPIG